MIYKVSFLVPGRRDVGTIKNMDHLPQVGDRVEFKGEQFEIIEVVELMPPRGDFGYLHATCRPLE
jgi:hypothetical protein